MPPNTDKVRRIAAKDPPARQITPPKGTACQEASPASHKTYIACGKPATVVVNHGRGEGNYAMCTACGDHNVKNRGAHYVMSGTEEAKRPLAVIAKTPDTKASLKAKATAAIPKDRKPFAEWISRLNQKTAELEQMFQDIDKASLATIMRALEEEEQVAAFIKMFRALRDLEDVISAGKKPISDRVEEFKTVKLPGAFESADVKTMTLDTGDRVTITERVLASIKGGMKDDAFKWLRKNKHGDLITETINSSTLAAFAKSILEENKALPDDLFNVAVQSQASLTRGKSK